MFNINISEILSSDTSKEINDVIEFMNEQKTGVEREVSRFEDISIPHLTTIRNRFGEESYQATKAELDRIQDEIQDFYNKITSVLADLEEVKEGLGSNGSEEIIEDFENIAKELNKRLESIIETANGIKTEDVRTVFDKNKFEQ